MSFIIGLLLSFQSLATEQFFISAGPECKLRVIVENPPKNVPVKADILHLIGFADRADNHDPLFKMLSVEGFRVVSFDYPSHGETKCQSLNRHSIHDLINLGIQVEFQTREDNKRPLILSGWSTGALLAILGVQQGLFATARPVTAVVAMAPAVSVYTIVGSGGFVTQSSMTNHPNPPHKGPYKPTTPFTLPAFAFSLIYNSYLSQDLFYPKEIPTLIMTAGKDRYVNTENVLEWFFKHQENGSKIHGVFCPNSLHEMDNQIEPIGQEVRNFIRKFVLTPQNPQIVSQVECQVL
jgi:pimeloyl-ACP methyl ester carboxylesterase